MILKYILYGSIWSKFGAKNSKSRITQVPNVLTSSQPHPNINETHLVIYHNKNALKSPGNTSGTFLNFLIYSTAEFGVSTRILRNETLATRGYHSADFKVNISIRFLENFYEFTSPVSGATRPRFPIDNSWI
jgi:hypothetical protein